MEEYVRERKVKMFVNPSVKQETRATPDSKKRRRLLNICKQLEFTPYNKTVLGEKHGARYPMTFVTEEEREMLQRLKECMPAGFEEDIKIFIDALANPEIDVLLTADRDDLAKRKLRGLLANEGLDNKAKILTPKEFYEQLQQGT